MTSRVPSDDATVASGFGLPSIDLLGFGLALADFDSDGELDAYAPAVGRGAAAADFDGDGDISASASRSAARLQGGLPFRVGRYMSRETSKWLRIAVISGLASLALVPVSFAATNAIIIGEIQFLTVDDPGDTYSSGSVVVGGQTVIVPRNLVIDVPANRLTLQQFFAQAPGDCGALGQSGLARADTCLGGGAGGVATILANHTNAGNVIAGDLFIEKGQETLTGVVTFIDHTDGYFLLNGNLGDSTTGAMVRINDPSGRHTIQQGLGCAVGSNNCSADERFFVDADNYTVTFSTGYPGCVPSTVTGGLRTTPSDANGIGDAFCPDTNRSVNGGNPVADSGRFAPIQLGDAVVADGNSETIGGATFLSAHTVDVGAALTTDVNQPDYLIFDEVEWDVAGFQNERTRTLLILFTTLGTSQLDIFALHMDPATNAENEFPLASTVGNPDTVNQGIPPAAAGIAKIRYDVDFILGAPVDPRLSPCVNLTNAGFTTCSLARTIQEEFSVVSPVSRDIIARSRNKTLNPGLQAFDTSGNDAPWGEYLTPVGIGHPEFVEIDLAAIQTPFIFAGEPWNLDRRLGPGGCDGPCEATAQPLDPFPFSDLDPRTQVALPIGAEDRILSFFPFGAADVLAWPPIDPAAIPIDPTPATPDVCMPGNVSPAAFGDSAVTDQDTAVVVSVLANDVDVDGFLDISTVVIVTAAANGTAVANPDGTVTYTPNAGFSGSDAFSYTVNDDLGATSNVATVTVTVNPAGNQSPVAADDSAVTNQDLAVIIAVLSNDSDSDGTLDVTSVAIVGPAANGSAVANVDGTVTYTPNAGFIGSDAFTYTVDDNEAATSNIATVSVTVNPANVPPVANDDSAVTGEDVAVNIAVLANDSDSDGTLDVTSVTVVSPALNGTTMALGDGTVTYTPNVAFTGNDSFTYTVDDNQGAPSNAATVSVTVNPAGPGDPLTVTRAEFRTSKDEWRIDGTATVTTNNVVTIYVGPTVGGTVIGTAVVDAVGDWSFRERDSLVLPDATQTLSIESSAGGLLQAVAIDVRN